MLSKFYVCESVTASNIGNLLKPEKYVNFTPVCPCYGWNVIQDQQIWDDKKISSK